MHITLLVAPVANFTATPLTGTNPLTVQFNDTSTGIFTAWNWDFGDESTSTEQNPVHIYTTAGTYSVNLTTANGAANDSETKTDLITVTDPAPSPKPTQVINRGSDGEPIPEITIVPINASEIPGNMNGAFTFAGSAYNCTPSGATFAPGITLSFTLSEDERNALGEGDFTIRFYDAETGEWVELPTTVNPETHTVTAEITHFSVFGLFSSAESVTTTPTQSTVSPSATVSIETMTGSQGDTTTVPETTQSAPLVCVPLLALGALAILRKRQ